MSNEAKPLPDPERVRRRLPDYFTILDAPWHLAVGIMGQFVNDEDCVVSEYEHIRNLFHVAQALAIEAKGKRTPDPAVQMVVEALRDLIGWMDFVDGQNNQWRVSYARAINALAAYEKGEGESP